ncbi:MAG: 30S ribosomal protein S15 [Candidatus Margulisbacteria bacterium]|nr:30S ribosomal protein S15 [Candidatus Margulisiibacteriota bacterium]MBU1021371.1 30S ribosomal protein S15 [Candidatus Margulisiibacteriota bacterium]MBU1729140.1 30S ribosomal protein S15 [Candidatus Margulisiibacteriota bacterium]MBU1954813.1 30S ribosomal protein S15 [Candidatus Margulisiibacteriota bacterium]
MTLNKDAKSKVMEQVKVKDNDTGSSDVQVALLTAQINRLVEHLRGHKKDKHGRHGLMNMVSKRKKLLSYLHRCNPKRYLSLIQKLGIRQ